jgi:hypothetical protein
VGASWKFMLENGILSEEKVKSPVMTTTLSFSARRLSSLRDIAVIFARVEVLIDFLGHYRVSTEL